MTEPRSFWVRWRVAAGYLLAVIGFYFARPTNESIITGACIAFVGLMIRAAAAGFVAASNSWIVAAVVSGYILTFYPAVVRREDRDLRERFGAEFAAYAARVSAFFPWPTKEALGGPKFSWVLYIRNHEYRAALGSLVAMGVLALRMWILIRFNR